MYTISLQFPNRTPVPIYGHIIILRFSLATILHLWLLVMQPHKRQPYGGIFAIMFLFFLFDSTETGALGVFPIALNAQF